MLLAIQILLGVLFAGTGIGLVVDLGKNRMDELKGSTGKQWASAFTVGIIANFLEDVALTHHLHLCTNFSIRLMTSIFLVH